MKDKVNKVNVGNHEGNVELHKALTYYNTNQYV